MGPTVIVIGAGIVGCALADELTARGWSRVTVLDQGPLFATGGSTSHAPGLVFRTTGDPTMTRFARATAAKYARTRLDGRACFRPVGGLEVATTRERLVDLHRRRGWARAAGIDAEVVDPGACAALHPLVDPDRVLGGLHVPGDGLAAPVAAAEAQARAATARGARVLGHHRVVGLDVRGGRVRGVETDRGRFDADVVVSCAGMWGPLVGALAGIDVPLVPMAHQYAWTTPLAALDVIQKLRGLADTSAAGGAVLPILRHQDADLYVREHGDRLGDRGLRPSRHAHRPGHPRHRLFRGRTATGGRPMPSERPLHRRRLRAELGRGDRAAARARRRQGRAGRQRALLLHPRRDAAAGGAPGRRRASGSPRRCGSPIPRGSRRPWPRWITDRPHPPSGASPSTSTGVHHDRFDPAVGAPATVRARASAAFEQVYDIVHPHAPAGGRPPRTGPFHARHRELGAVLGEHDGWARPLWFADNADLPEVCEVRPRREWAGRHWSPVAGAEALVVRRAVALVDLTDRHRVEVTGPNALGLLQQLTTADVDVPVGTRRRALALDRTGCIRADLDVARLGPERFAVGVTDRLEVSWLRSHVLGDVEVRDVTAGTCAVGVWGPRAADLLARLGARPDRDAAEVAIGPVGALALRGTPIGEDGWELRTTADVGTTLWDVLWDAGAGLGVVAAGHHAVTSLLVEAGHRGTGLGVDTALTPAEAGLGHLVDAGKGLFLGRGPDDPPPPTRRLMTMVLDDPAEVVLGGEPVLAGDTPVGRVVAAEVGQTAGASLALAVLRVAHAAVGTALTIEYFDRRVAAVVSAAPAPVGAR